MTVMPIQSPSKRASLAPSFGKASYFAFVYGAGEEVTIVSNRDGSGMAMVEMIRAKGADTVVIKGIEREPLEALFDMGVRVYYAGSARITIEGAAARMVNQSLEQVTPERARALFPKR